uniref:U2 small nuclear ribonucleoprotein auxiliary factor 35 kDa subunit-related protein 1 n=1 Tax=Cacopsylla melanoneura TaxID=428564 RepID=A0A8D8SF98_9HEMI
MGRHSEWRKVAKKCRRSRIRRLKAQERDTLLEEEELENLKSSIYLTWKKEQEALELFARVEEERIREEVNKKWIERELKAQEEWRESQEKIALFKAEKAKQELLIREEWDREQKKIKEIEKKNLQEKEAREQRESEFKQRVEDFISGVSGELPEGFRTNVETRPDKELCPFFVKVGACRFFDNCSRNHVKPAVSKTLLLNNFFSHLSMDNKSVREYDTDMSLEYDDKEMYKHFLDFYDDAMPELRSFGKVIQFKVCCNLSPHLRGNVYVSYATEREALKAYYALMGRYYGGRQIRGQFTKVPLWSKALCGLFLRKKCPKGGTCNFLHVFRNPTSEFVQADMDCEEHKRDESCSRSTISSKRHSSSWAWSSGDDSSEEDRENENKNIRNQRNKNRRQRSRERSSIRRIDSSDRKNKRDRSKERSSRSKIHDNYREKSSRNQTYDSDRYGKRDSRRNDSINYKDCDKKRRTSIDRNSKHTQGNSEDANKDERVKEIDPKRSRERSAERSRKNCDRDRIRNGREKKRSISRAKDRPTNDEDDLKSKDRSRNDEDDPNNKNRSRNYKDNWTDNDRSKHDVEQNGHTSDEESSFEYKKQKHKDKSKEVG